MSDDTDDWEGQRDRKETCQHCGRPVLWSADEYDGPVSPEGRIVIGHGGYGCDTGCCGLEAVYQKPGDKRDGGRVKFDFMHNEAAFQTEIERAYPGVPIVLTCWTCCEGDSAHKSMKQLGSTA